MTKGRGKSIMLKGAECIRAGVYRITQEALQKAIGNAGRSYSSGDLEVIALEIAMENYRAEMVATTKIYGGDDSNNHSPESEVNHLDGRDYLSSGWSYDATFLLTGQKAEVYKCSANKLKNPQPYQDGKHGYITVEEMNRRSKYDLKKEYGAVAKGSMSEVTHVTNRDSDLQRMLDKYQGHEKDFALTFSVRVAKKGPDGHTKAGGLHEITVVKITDSTVYVANPWHPDKIEPIPRNEFERMATSFSATPINNNNVSQTYLVNNINDMKIGVNQTQTDTLNQTLMNLLANKLNHREGGTTISSERFSQYLEQFNNLRPSSQRLNANTLLRRLNNAAKMNLNQEQLDFINRLYVQMTNKGDIKISAQDRKILASLNHRQ